VGYGPLGEQCLGESRRQVAHLERLPLVGASGKLPRDLLGQPAELDTLRRLLRREVGVADEVEPGR
jgi:hypothetical protein